MRSKLKQVFKRWAFRRKLAYIAIDKSSIVDWSSFDVNLRKPKPGNKYLTAGRDSYIGGKYIFERSSGMVAIGNRVHIGGSTFISINRIEIGDDVTIAWGCTIYDHNSHSVDWKYRQYDTAQELFDLRAGRSPISSKDWSHVDSRPIKICDKVWIGCNCIILKGVTIGEGAVVAAGSVVVKDVEPWTVVGGNPAQYLKKLERSEFDCNDDGEQW